MSTKSQNERIIFGLKVKQLRRQKKLSFAELAEKTGMSVSYLNEIEKGKKYPKPDKIEHLAKELGAKTTYLLSSELDKNLAPVGELLRSNFLNELPLDLFGIELAKVVEIIANAPVRVSAFISTLLELSRNYALKEENFYFGALRSYLELNNNYFPEIEEAVDAFCRRYDLPEERPLPVPLLKRILEDQFGYIIVEKGLDDHPELQNLRSVYLPARQELLLSSRLTDMQQAFQFGKEIAFHYLDLKERANTSSLLRSRVFEEVLNHSKATYFSVALHIPLQAGIKDMKTFFQREKWDGAAFLGIMQKYQANPEMFYHRLTNILPQFFGVNKLFFLRFTNDPKTEVFEVDRELQLDSRHHPHSNALFEHYCRRWIAITMLQDLKKRQQKSKPENVLVGIQRSHYIGTDAEYLCFTLARPAYPSPNQNVSVTLGLLVTEDLKEKIRFLDDPAIPRREVNNTCERCPLTDCLERAAEPSVINKRDQLRRIQQKINELDAGE